MIQHRRPSLMLGLVGLALLGLDPTPLVDPDAKREPDPEIPKCPHGIPMTHACYTCLPPAPLKRVEFDLRWAPPTRPPNAKQIAADERNARKAKRRAENDAKRAEGIAVRRAGGRT